ncbi:MAG: carboxypeptidase-like regulatory domain-containing protein [Lewinellaceae bacterium]|nr:carboxypeptidase-like regulatory domain-containing protein [Lewinellaceae bacterium]
MKQLSLLPALAFSPFDFTKQNSVAMAGFLFSLLFSISLNAQKTTVKGRVLDKSKEPLIGANIFLQDTYDGATSDAEGNFQFDTEETGTQVLLVKYLGYDSVSQQVNLQGGVFDFNPVLRESFNELKIVVISAGSFEASDPFLFKGTVFSTGGYSAQYGQGMSSALILDTQDMPDRSAGTLAVSCVGLGFGQQKLWKDKGRAIGGSVNYTNLGPYFSLAKQSLVFTHKPGYVGKEGFSGKNRAKWPLEVLQVLQCWSRRL